MIESESVEWQEKKVFAFLDMLLRTGEVREAGNIWRKHFNTETILYNGDFSKKFLRRAFAWRVKKDKGFAQRLDQKAGDDSIRSIHYRFKGWENLNFHHLYQIVPVDGRKKYKLTAEFKSQKLTTDQRPFLEVYGYKCKMPYAQSEMVQPDQDWMQHEVVFGVPEECAAAVIRLRRKESHHIDNKLAGKVWLRNLAITDMGEDFTILDELPQ